MKNHRLYVRGLNYLGQCGLGKKVQYTGTSFIPNDFLPNTINKVHCNQAHNFILDSNNKTIYFFGFRWDLRSIIRTTLLYQKLPNLMQIAKYIVPTLYSFPFNPCELAKFDEEILEIDVGGAFACIINSKGLAYSVGDNELVRIKIIYIYFTNNINCDCRSSIINFAIYIFVCLYVHFKLLYRINLEL